MFEIHYISISIQYSTPPTRDRNNAQRTSNIYLASKSFEWENTLIDKTPVRSTPTPIRRNICRTCFPSNLASKKKKMENARSSWKIEISPKYRSSSKSDQKRSEKIRRASLISSSRDSSRLKFLRTAVEWRRRRKKKEKGGKKKKKRTDEKEAKRGIQRDDHPAGGRGRPASLHCSSDRTFRRRRRTLCALEERFARR